MNDVVEISQINSGSVTNIIVTFEEKYYYIEDDYFKIEDVKRMSKYISYDWFVHNRKILTLNVINRHLHKLNDIDKELRHELMVLRRTLFIDNILK